MPLIYNFRLLQYLISLKQLFFDNLMCFFKTLFQTPLEGAGSLEGKAEKASWICELETKTDFLEAGLPEEKDPMKPDLGMMLLNCLNLMNLNSQFLFRISQKLDQTADVLHETKVCLRTPTPTPLTLAYAHLAPPNHPLTHILFGRKLYQYRLVLNRDFPNTLYKDRNFSCSIKLVGVASGREQNNGNILNVCFGFCDSQGQWIHETKEGQSFVKGKIESELYHGSAEFVKLAPRDVSRQYSKKTVNIVVYAKPTVLRYSGESSIEEHIDYNLVEPLIISDISIKAKKRNEK